ncbi:class I SAM-dependent methyltransferase [Streptomyces sp. PR69]|uniref:class I SAM-dependent methyltransferase n=1 Tax=Streptomyces sp. PR69 TaxID=2984950 RepID=UPI0022648286|nr:class I SAM-dependent methyltransferase [Streptomyces sp. PR69]
MVNPQIANPHQAEAWNGYEGRHWAAHPDRYDALNDPANTPLLDAARLTRGDRVLDIGCGNGHLTRLAARRCAAALGVDLSGPMLEQARATAEAEGIGNVSFVQADAQVHPFEEASFDAALSRFGIMFFADPVAAFANIGWALRPGGRLAFVCPQEFARFDHSAVFEAIAAHVPLPALDEEPKDDEPPTGPSSFADPDRTRRVLGAAGYTGIDISELETFQHWGEDAEAAAEFLFEMGPMRHWLSDADPAALARARTAATDLFRSYETADGVRLVARLWLVTAGWQGPSPEAAG